VGYKGTGKSALLSVLKSEEEGNGNLAISVQPDDILEISSEEEDFLKMIREWKRSLSEQ